MGGKNRKYNIKWRESDYEDLKKAVKNFNAKIARLEKNPEFKDKNALPERIRIAQIRELIDTRQDFNRELNALRRFTRRGAEEVVDVPDSQYNLKTTKWQKKEMIMRTGLINRKRKEKLAEISEIKMKSGGKDLGYTRGEFAMGEIDENALKPLNAFFPTMGRADLNMRYRHMRKESQEYFFTKKDATLRENYVRALQHSYGKDAQRVIDKIEGMDFKQFYEIYKADSGTMEFASKLPQGVDYAGYVEHLENTWLHGTKGGE